MRTRADNLKPGQKIRLTNALRATVLESGPYHGVKDQWLLKLQLITPKNLEPFHFTTKPSDPIELDTQLAVVR